MKNRIISDETLKKVIFNILKAVGIVVYFIVLILAFNTIKQERLVEDIKVFSGVFLILALIVLERAYKKDSGVHMTALLKYDFKSYMIASSVVFGVYYVLKAIIVYTKGRKDYLKSLNDISEIVKKDEPLKKEAKKRKKEVKEDG